RRLRVRARLPDVRRSRREHRTAGEDRGTADSRSDCQPAAAGRRGVSSLADRLRGIVGQTAVGTPGSGAPGGPDRVRATGDIDKAAEILGGEWHDLRGERFLVLDRKYLPGHRHGHVTVADTL